MRTFKHENKTVHDFLDKHLGWGWNIIKINWKVISQKADGFYTPGDKFELQGAGKGLEQGDLMLIEFKAGVCCFEIDEVEYKRDPPDLWYAKLTYCGEVDMEGK